MMHNHQRLESLLAQSQLPNKYEYTYVNPGLFVHTSLDLHGSFILYHFLLMVPKISSFVSNGGSVSSIAE